MAGLVAIGCGSGSTPTPTPLPAASSTAVRQGDPAPASELAFGRAAFEALQRGDWDGYTKLLATRGDMMGLYSEVDRSEGRERRKRRRMVWRRVNRLRNGEAEEGWTTTRRKAELEGVAWDAVRLVDVRREPVSADRLPPGTEAAELQLVLEHGGVERVLGLGACVKAKRGWVALYPLVWQGAREGELGGESLMGRTAGPAAAAEPGPAPTPAAAPAPAAVPTPAPTLEPASEIAPAAEPSAP